MKYFFQQGQTLIETVVAIFIMVMGISAALGLASYSLNASTGIQKQIIGIGLAREGMEALKNVRDTTWLNAELHNDCYNFRNPSLPAPCYHVWDGLGQQSYRLRFDAGVGNQALPFTFWAVELPLPSESDPWALYSSTDPLKGFYDTNIASGPQSGFRREIIITPDMSPPFDKLDGNGQYSWPRILLTSKVWWTDKNCPESEVWPGRNKCSIQLEMYLTNWKTY